MPRNMLITLERRSFRIYVGLCAPLVACPTSVAADQSGLHSQGKEVFKSLTIKPETAAIAQHIAHALSIVQQGVSLPNAAQSEH